MASQLETIYETLLTVPGMHDNVKIDLKIPRKTVLLLTEVLRHGMEKGAVSDSKGLISNLSGNVMEELDTIINDSLEKAGLTALSEKLNSIAK